MLTAINARQLVCVTSLAIAFCAGGTFARADEAKAKLEFHLAKLEKTDGFQETKVGDITIWMAKRASIVNADIMSAQAEENTVDGVTHHIVEVRFTEAGGKKMRELTDKNRDSLIAIVVDGKVISAPVIRATIGERAWITAKFTKAQAEDLAKRINEK